MMTPPTISKYARYPDDMRYVREWLRERETVQALYVGTAYGEDMFSWLNVDLGTGATVVWAGLEPDVMAYRHCREATDQIYMLNKGVMDHAGQYDLIVANNVWRADSADNVAMLKHIQGMCRGILIARGANLERVGWWGHAGEGTYPIWCDGWPLGLERKE